MKKIMAFVMACLMVLNLSVVAKAELVEVKEEEEYEETSFTDGAGNKTTIKSTIEKDGEIYVECYVNGVLANSALSKKNFVRKQQRKKYLCYIQ